MATGISSKHSKSQPRLIDEPLNNSLLYRKPSRSWRHMSKLGTFFSWSFGPSCSQLFRRLILCPKPILCFSPFYTKSLRNLAYLTTVTWYQSTNKVATTMLVAAAAFAFMPFRIIFVLILLEAYTRHMPLRKKSSEKLVRRLREWWLRIPAAPVQLLRPHDSRRWRSRRR